MLMWGTIIPGVFLVSFSFLIESCFCISTCAVGLDELLSSFCSVSSSFEPCIVNSILRSSSADPNLGGMGLLYFKWSSLSTSICLGIYFLRPDLGTTYLISSLSQYNDMYPPDPRYLWKRNCLEVHPGIDSSLIQIMQLIFSLISYTNVPR